MKKIVFLLGVLPFFAGGLYAQQEELPDGKFEYWKTGTTDGGDSYDDLANPFWESLNMLSELPPEMFAGPVTLFKDAGRSGAADDFAPKLVSDKLQLDATEIFLPGVVGALTVVIDDQSALFGRPFTSRPSAIRGYMKYKPVDNDSASIFVEVYRYNEAAGKRQTIGKVEGIFTETIEDWTEFNLPIEYTSPATPDSITVLFVSSAGYDFEDLFNCKGQIGSTLWVDDVAFVYEGTANENPQLATSGLYPNPSADGLFNLEVKVACRMEVFSVSGQLLQQGNLGAGNHTLDISRHRPGIYYVRLTNAEGSAVLKAIVR